MIFDLNLRISSVGIPRFSQNQVARFSWSFGPGIWVSYPPIGAVICHLRGVERWMSDGWKSCATSFWVKIDVFFLKVWCENQRWEWHARSLNRCKSWDGVASCSPRFVDCLRDFSTQLGLTNLLQVSLQLHSSEVHWWPSLRGLHPADSSWGGFSWQRCQTPNPLTWKNECDFLDVCKFSPNTHLPIFLFPIGKSWGRLPFRGKISVGFFEASEASKVCQREGAEGLNSFFGRQPDRWDAPRSNHAGSEWWQLLRVGSMI